MKGRVSIDFVGYFFDVLQSSRLGAFVGELASACYESCLTLSFRSWMSCPFFYLSYIGLR